MPMRWRPGLELDPQDPAAIKDYTFDWSEWLGTDTIATHIVTVDTGLTLESDSLTADLQSIVVWLSGGTSGQVYDVSCQITTAAGRTDKRSVKIRIAER